MEKTGAKGNAAKAGGWAGRLPRISGMLLMAAMVVWLWRSWDQEAMWEWKQEVHPLIFFLLMAVLPAVGFPVTPFYLFAGAAYGTAVGLAGTWGALALNLALCYWIARSGLRPVLKRLLDRAGIRLPDVHRKNELKFTLVVKLAPGVPAFAKNYLLGLAEVSFGTYFLVSLVIAGLYASSLIVLGDSVFDRDPGMAVGAVAFLILLTGGFYWWRRKAGKDG